MQERSEIIMVRVNPQDKKAFEAAAEELDMKVSEFVRAATLMYLAITMNPHALKSLVKRAAESVKEIMQRLREPGLRKALWGLGKQFRMNVAVNACRILQAMAAKQLKVVEVCALCGVNNKTLAKILRGELPRRFDAFYRVVNGLEIPFQQVIIAPHIKQHKDRGSKRSGEGKAHFQWLNTAEHWSR